MIELSALKWPLLTKISNSEFELLTKHSPPFGRKSRFPPNQTVGSDTKICTKRQSNAILKQNLTIKLSIVFEKVQFFSR